ncbi:S9 family peptidase [uncultured Phyllobacterium sp.]|nr:S9 family peptidase [uncultured Phyllobacterium sp.]
MTTLDALQTDPALSMSHYIDISKAVKPAVSPDGALLAYLSDESGTLQVWVRPLAGGSARQLTTLSEPVGNLAFNPKSRDLLITTDWGGDERHQLWLIENAKEEPRLLTTDTTVVHGWGCWSPDGLQIAYSANYRDRAHMDLYVMTIATGQVKCVHQGQGWRTPFAFSPDGAFLLVNDCQRAMMDQDFCRLDLATGAYENILPHAGRARYLAPKFFKDNSGILMISDQEREYLSLMVKLHEADTFLELAAFAERDIEALAIAPDQARIALVVNRQGWNDLVIIDRAGNILKQFATPMPCVIGSVAWTPDGTALVMPIEGGATSGDIWRCDAETGKFTRLTDASKAAAGLPDFIEPTVTSVAGFDGLDIPYFVYRPKVSAKPNGYPVMIVVHGGPEAQWKPDFRADIQYMLAKGIMVVAPNVRGSTGYGRRYQHLDDRELRMDSVADLKAVRIAVGARQDVDENRIGVFGRSYGGFMVLSAMTEYPDLWRLGVEYYGIANFLTLLQTTGPWRKQLRAAEYGDVETMRGALERYSPINRIDAINAPLMIAHGMEDPRVTPCESEMVYSCLRGLGKPVEYLRVPHEGHGFARIENRRRVFGALARFIAENL